MQNAISDVILRLEVSEDNPLTERLTFEAFETMVLPGRTRTNEHFLAHLLRKDPCFIPELDFVAELNGELVGSIFYSHGEILRPNGTVTKIITFGPLSVKPLFHRKGIGSLLVRHSLTVARDLGYRAILITGHPAYYARFGFVPASQFGLTFLNGESFDAFMALELAEGSLGDSGGKWKWCQAFDAVEFDNLSLEKFNQALFGSK